MRARLRSWWQRIKQHPVRLAVIIGAGMLGIALLVVLVLGYIFNWGWTGLGSYIPPTKVSNFQREKTLWDWLQLLIVPLVLAVGGFWLSQMQKTTEQRRTTDNQHEAALQAYIDKISELLLKEQLGERTEDGKLKSEGERAQKIARVRTITVLTQLDARRIGYVFAFLREAGLMSTTPNNNVVSLSKADLHAVNWSQADIQEANLSEAHLQEADLIHANLSGANLSGAYLYKANLSGFAYLYKANLSGAVLYKANLSIAILSEAHLTNADLREADLREADLSGADLSGADLSEANLSGATITTEQLEEAKSLKGATLPDGSKHP